MADSKVNGKATSNPAGYDSFDNNKKVISRTTQLQHGKEERGFEAKAHAKAQIGDIFQKIRAWKEENKPLENVVIIKAQSNNKEIER